MPGPLPALAAAAFVLAAPAGAPAPAANPPEHYAEPGSGPPPVITPVAVATGDGSALVAWSGTADATSRQRDVLARTVAPDGTLGPVAPLTATAPGQEAAAPALLARGDGRFLMAYSERAAAGGRIRRTVRVRLVAPGGPLDATRTARPGVAMHGYPKASEAAPALAWGPGRRWAVVTWAEQGAGTQDARVVVRRVTPGGAPLGRPRVVARQAVPEYVPGSFGFDWANAAPTAATDGDGVLVVWEDTGTARLRGVRVGAGGAATPVALGLRATAQRRALGRRAGRVRETAPRLVTRPGGRPPVLAWGATIAEQEETSFRSAVLVATAPRAGTVRALSVPEDLTSTDAEIPSVLVVEPSGTIAAAWTVEVLEFGRGCADHPPYGRRLDATLRPLGAPRRLSRGDDPRGPDTYDNANAVECSQPVDPATLAPVRGGLLAAYPYAPYLDARILPGA